MRTLYAMCYISETKTGSRIGNLERRSSIIQSIKESEKDTLSRQVTNSNLLVQISARRISNLVFNGNKDYSLKLLEWLLFNILICPCPSNRSISFDGILYSVLEIQCTLGSLRGSSRATLLKILTN